MAHPFTPISPRDGAENGDGENSVPDDDDGSKEGNKKGVKMKLAMIETDILKTIRLSPPFLY